jgi:hypothetical protein
MGPRRNGASTPNPAPTYGFHRGGWPSERMGSHSPAMGGTKRGGSCCALASGADMAVTQPVTMAATMACLQRMPGPHAKAGPGAGQPVAARQLVVDPQIVLQVLIIHLPILEGDDIDQTRNPGKDLLPLLDSEFVLDAFREEVDPGTKASLCDNADTLGTRSVP